MDRLLTYAKSLDNSLSAFLYTREFDDILPSELKEGVFSYFKNGGKRLRPVLLSLVAGALGGKEKEKAALPAALAVELFHTFTLVHDDIIDNDSLRRGIPTVHTAISNFAEENKGLDKSRALEYGKSMALLAGDILHGASVEMISLGSYPYKVKLKMITLLETKLLRPLITGEAIDTRDSFFAAPLQDNDIEYSHILETLRLKTGVLLGSSALFGAMIGLDTPNEKDPSVRAMYTFAENCGIAFQLKDDILGLEAEEKKLGKPIGSDIREGKRTIILLESYKNCDKGEKRFLSEVIGNKTASEADIVKAKDIILSRGGKEYTEKMCLRFTNTAVESLSILPDSEYKELLLELASYMTGRSL